jgi:general secretion pathway protein N
MSQSSSTIKKGRWISFGVLLFIIFSLSRVPAEWGAWLMTRQSGLAMSGISGSLWKGQANVASLTAEGQTYTLGKLQWDLQLMSLLKLKPCATIIVSGQAQSLNGIACVGTGGSIALRDADMSLPASLLQSKIPIPINGNFSVHISELELKGNVLLKLDGNLSWTNAQANNDVQWISLGSFAAEFSDNKKNGIKAKLFDLESDIDLILDLELRAPNGGAANGTLDMPQTMIDRYKLADFLAFLGPQSSVENGKSRYQIQQEF